MGKKDKNRNQEIDLLKLGYMLLGKIWFLILFTVVAGGIAFAYTYLFVTPLYKSSVTLYVNNNTNKENTTYVSSADLNASAKLVDTYAAIIQSNSVLSIVINETGKAISTSGLKSRVSIHAVNETEVFVVSVVDENPEMAAKIAKAFSNAVISELPMIIEGTSVKVIDSPVVPTSKNSPNYIRNIEMGALLGLVLSAMFFVLRDLLDRSIKSVEDFSQWDYPVLASVPDLDEDSQYGYGRKKSHKKSADDKDEEKEGSES